MGLNVSVVGATGLVGQEMRQILLERKFPLQRIRFLASERSAGKVIDFDGEKVTVENLENASFDRGEIILSSAGGKVSRVFAPRAAEQGAVVIDNTSAFRMEKDVPLVVPEVNPEEAFKHRGIIANPNCSTIQMVVVLKPLHDFSPIERIVVSTYQAVSGAGWKASQELFNQCRNILDKKPVVSEIFPHQIAFNVLPQIPQSNAFLDNRYSEEEMKMINETRKIMGDESIKITATTVRVPVFRGHSESVNVETRDHITREQAIEILSKAPGVEILDDPGHSIYPLAINAEGKDATYVGRIREDLSCENALDIWIVSDNLRKGAALNAVQIAELLVSA